MTTIRKVLVLLVSAALGVALGVGGSVKSAPGPSPALPTRSSTISVTAPARGMSTTGSGPSARAHLGLPATHADMHGCTDSPKSEVKLGMLKRSAVYAHCNFP